MSYRTPGGRDGDAPAPAPPVRVVLLEKSWWQPGHTRLELDVAKEELRATETGPLGTSKTVTWPTRHVRCARRTVDDEGAEALALVIDDEEKKVGNGTEASCDAAVVAIDQFLATVREVRAERARVTAVSDTLFADWDDLDDEDKWTRMDGILSRVPVDERTIERSDDDIELHGTKGGFTFRVVFDALDPEGCEIALDVAQSFIVTELTYDPLRTAEDEPVRDPTWEPVEGRTFFGKHVYTPYAAEAFRRIPEALRTKIRMTMEEEHVAHFRIASDVLELSSPAPIRTVKDPIAHLTRILDVLVETAQYLTTG